MNRGKLPKRIVTKTKIISSKYPFDEMAYGVPWLFLCDKNERKRVQYCVRQATFYRNAPDYKIKTKTVEGGIIVTKIKKEV